MGRFTSKYILKILVLFCLVYTPFLSGAELSIPLKMRATVDQVQPGDAFDVLVSLDLQDGWHLYWKNPGDSGLAPVFTWDLPEGITQGSFDWPVPKSFESEGVKFNGYEGAPTWVARFHSAQNLPLHDVVLQLHVSWLACKDLCVPGESSGILSIPVGQATIENQKALQELKDSEKSLPLERKVHVKISGDLLEVSIPLPQLMPLKASDFEGSEVHLFPESEGITSRGSNVEWKVEDGIFKADVLLDGEKASDFIASGKYSGVLAVTRQGEVVSFSLHGMIQGLEGSMSRVSRSMNADIEKMVNQHNSKDLLLIALLAFIGGIILNIMPCVLPVIGIKVLHLAKMKELGRMATFKLGLTFTAGVLVSFWVLAGAIFFLQRTGKLVGWGFQLQEPLFVLGMIIVLFLFSMSLFGLFEFGTRVSSFAGEIQQSHASKSARGALFSSFLSGVLSTMVASPCTGPLLGTVLGFSATLDWQMGLLVFTSLAVGMAFPFLLLSLIPELAIFLPRPGPWMVTFKQFLGFCMLATVVWLTWVLNAQVGPFDLTYLLVFFFVLSIASWIWGIWGTPYRYRFVRVAAGLISLFLVAVPTYYLVLRVKEGPKSAEKEVFSDGWKPYSPEALKAALQQGKTVFVNFTAKWCLTCQTNKWALHSAKAQAAFKEHEVVLLLADWTSNDRAVTKALQSLGRNSVPVYALYKTGASTPILLPEILTPDIIVSSLETK